MGISQEFLGNTKLSIKTSLYLAIKSLRILQNINLAKPKSHKHKSLQLRQNGAILLEVLSFLQSN